VKLTLGFSPCPNDTFIFDAMVNKKIDTGDIEFEVVLEDVETLNEWAMEGKLDITKLSFPAFFQSLDKYILLTAGSALGEGVGPLLISNKEHRTRNVEESEIAIPGENTTANLLLSFAFPNAKNKKPMLFSLIEDAVLSGKTDLGLIIHESRFTYQQKGLHKLMDLGEFWETKMQTPIPLGGIAIKKTVNIIAAQKVNSLIRASLDHAFKNYPVITGYVKQHSQEMSEEVMRQHIDLYVNKFSLDLGEKGKQAIDVLRQVYNRIKSIDGDLSGSLFIS
jgi:1,4-dihydroxy-6-naphthoate synthase